MSPGIGRIESLGAISVTCIVEAFACLAAATCMTETQEGKGSSKSVPAVDVAQRVRKDRMLHAVQMRGLLESYVSARLSTAYVQGIQAFCTIRQTDETITASHARRPTVPCPAPA